MFPFLIGKVLTCLTNTLIVCPRIVATFPFLIGKVLTTRPAILYTEVREFPFLIGKVLTKQTAEHIGEIDGVELFPFLIGKVLTYSGETVQGWWQCFHSL